MFVNIHMEGLLEKNWVSKEYRCRAVLVVVIHVNTTI